MTHMTLDRPQTARFAEVPFTGQRQRESPLPAKTAAGESICPHCQNAWERPNPHTLQRLKQGFVQLFSAVGLIVFSVVRLARLVIATAFSLLGVVGFGLNHIAKRVVHPHDRQLLPHAQRRR